MPSIAKAVALLQAGKLVGLPTETVYGLGADASNPSALAKVFFAKERPFTHPLIVHLASAQQLAEWARDIPPAAFTLTQAFWPGPLTLILKKQLSCSDLLTGNQDTIGLRVPAHPVALALLQAFGKGIAAPSANRYTHLSPTTAQAVREELGDKVDYVLEGGTCEVGIESTILDLSREQPVILRPGMITAVQIEKVLQQPVTTLEGPAPRVSGMGALHYAPDTSLVLVSSEKIPSFIDRLTPADLPLAILTTNKPPSLRDGVQYIVMSPDPHAYAHDLYFTLRALDKENLKKIIVQVPSLSPEWEAINDRLKKASRNPSL